jgi:hypothetical protein
MATVNIKNPPPPPEYVIELTHEEAVGLAILLNKGISATVLNTLHLYSLMTHLYDQNLTASSDKVRFSHVSQFVGTVP